VLVDKLLELSPQPTGVFVPQDKMTAVVYRLLLKRGVKPGREIAIISADNEAPYLAGLCPRPPTIDIGIDQQGQKAVELLLWRMRSETPTKGELHLTLNPKLVERDDT